MTRGGTRKGAGRKALPDNQKLKKVNISLRPSRLAELKRCAAMARVPFREHIRNLIDMSTLKYTRELPEKAGWYFIRVNGGQAEVTKVFLPNPLGQLHYHVTNITTGEKMLMPVGLHHVVEWAGPILEPTEPIGPHVVCQICGQEYNEDIEQCRICGAE